MRFRSIRPVLHCSEGSVLTDSRIVTASEPKFWTPEITGSSTMVASSNCSSQRASATSLIVCIARSRSVSYATSMSRIARAQTCDIFPTRRISPFGICQRVPRMSRMRVVLNPTDSTVPVASPTSITSPTPYWSSMSMKMPLSRSRTSDCAPKPTATPTIPAPAINGPRLMSNSPRSIMKVTTPTTAEAMLLNRTPRVLAR